MKKRIKSIVFTLILTLPNFYFSSQLPQIKFRDLQDHSINLDEKRGKTILLLFFDPSNTGHKGKLVYSQVMYNKYKTEGLEIIGISSDHIAETKNLQLGGGLTFPITVDSNSEIHDLFQLNACCGGTILVNSEGNITFRETTLINKENLRQLVEKALFNKVSYSFQLSGPIITDRILSKITSLSLRERYSDISNAIFDFKERNLIITFFSSLCSVCKSGSRIETLKSLNSALLNIGSNNNIKTILVFFEPFNEHDIEFWEQNLKIPFDIYFSEDLFTDNEKYITDESMKIDPITVVLNETREVVFLEKLNISEKEILDSLLNIFLGKIL